MSYGRDGSVSITQPPGAGNALGRIRFNFPNKFSVYQHDTPDKYMFAHERRAYSHGCMRVQDPDKYAEVLLRIANPDEAPSAERIRAMYGTGERDIQLQYQIPVHLTYQTAYVDGSGHLVIREDIYGRDAKLISLLKSDERRVADQPTASDRREASAAASSGSSNSGAPQRRVGRSCGRPKLRVLRPVPLNETAETGFMELRAPPHRAALFYFGAPPPGRPRNHRGARRRVAFFRHVQSLAVLVGGGSGWR